MATTKKTKTQNNLATVHFGYALFALTILAVSISTVAPLGHALTYPTAKHFNIVLILISFITTAILPALISYLIGDRATHLKNKSLHHYNGVLFGFASYWLMLVFGYFGFTTFPALQELSSPVGLLVNGAIPVILTIAVMVLLAVSSAKKRKTTQSVLHHRPYQVVLITSFLATLLISLAPQYLSAETYTVLALLFLVIPLSMVFISYKLLSVLTPSRAVAVTAGVIAVSVAFITANVFSQLMINGTLSMFTSLAIGLIAWIAYLVVMVRGRNTSTAL